MEVQQQLPRDLAAPWRARRLLDRFAVDVPPECLSDARLVVSELVANCVRHGGNAAQLTVQVSRGYGHLQVWVACAKGLTRLGLRHPGYRCDGGGLGLRIVDRLATEWGVEDHGLDTVVWAKVPFHTRVAPRSASGVGPRERGD